MPTQLVFSSVRPQRTAFLINIADPHWQDNCLRLLNYCTQVWGGLGSIFIPTDGTAIEEVFWALLSSFEPDHIGCFRRTGLDIERHEPDRFEAILEDHLHAWEAEVGERTPQQIDHITENIRGTSATNWSISEALQLELRTRLNPFHFQEHVVEVVVDSDSKPSYPETALLDILETSESRSLEISTPHFKLQEEQLWASTETGIANPEFRRELEIAKVTFADSESDVREWFSPVLSASLGFRKDPSKLFLADLNRTGLGAYSGQALIEWKLPTLMVCGRSIEDYCLYQNLSRMRPRVVWLPPWLCSAEKRQEGLHDDFYFVSALKHLTAYSHRHNSSLELVSFSLDQDLLNQIKEAVIERSLQNVSWSLAQTKSLGSSPLRLYEANNVAYPDTVNLNDDGAIEMFAPRKPKTVKNINPQKVRWISELQFAGLQIPRHPSIAPRMMGSLSNEARASRNALAFLNVKMFVRGTDDAETAGVRPTIQLLNAKQVFETVASAASLNVDVSDKGIYSRVLIEKFGGLINAANFLGSSKGKRFIELYKDSATNSELGIYLQDERRLYLDAKALGHICENPQIARELLDKLVESGILYRGFIFQCQYCRRAAWYPVSDLSDSFTCKRCHRQQIYTSMHWKKPEQPLWYHQLDEVIYQAIRHDCQVPILAMASLARISEGRFSFTEELHYRKEGESKIWLESDLNCLLNGQIVLGEAKKTDRLGGSAKEEHRVVQGYLSLAKALHAEIVVFATSKQEWRPATKTLIDATFAETQIQVTFLTSEHL